MFLFPSPALPPFTARAGGTLIECQRLLATQGAAHVSAYVTHGVFPNESWRRFEGEHENGAADGFKWVLLCCLPSPAVPAALAARACSAHAAGRLSGCGNVRQEGRAAPAPHPYHWHAMVTSALHLLP